jgi:hypothetical protein
LAVLDECPKRLLRFFLHIEQKSLYCLIIQKIDEHLPASFIKVPTNLCIVPIHVAFETFFAQAF